ncbi:MAG: membrane protein insertase YidC [bacterium]|nr:membrane protein insertase YidC [bacterium]
MDRNAWIAVLLIGLVLFLSSYLQDLFYPKPPPKVERFSDTLTTKSTDSIATKDSAAILTKPILRALDTTVTQATTPLRESIPWNKRTTDLSFGKTKVITSLYTAIIAWDGARFVSWKLHPNGKYLKDSVETVRPEGYSITPGIVFRDGGVRSADYVIYKGSDTLITLKNKEKGQLFLEGYLNEVGAVKLAYTFQDGHFEFQVTSSFQANPQLTSGNGVWILSPGLYPTEDARATAIAKMIQTGEEYFVGSHVWLGTPSNGTHEEFSPNADKMEKFEATGVTLWVAQRSKYFLVALSPIKNGLSVQMNSDIGPVPKWKTQRVQITVPSDNLEYQYTTRVFWGPLKQSYVSSFAENLDIVMNWGWAIIRPISKGVLWILTTLYSVIPNYGLVILVFTIIIKIVLWPLTAKQFRSMKEMALLQPLMQEIRTKYKDNPKKMQEEMFKLYAEYKVNPAAGCLPMLLQMPILYALFIVFRSTIELREAPFILWIKDLSQPEAIFYLNFSIPLYGSNVALLPILMGISQFYMTKQTSSPDPNQKFMMYFFPIFMTVIFNSFPSGLVLYYFLYNIATMVQQHFIKGTTDKKIPEIKKA